jgi:hypothetical protein
VRPCQRRVGGGEPLSGGALVRLPGFAALLRNRQGRRGLGQLNRQFGAARLRVC